MPRLKEQPFSTLSPSRVTRTQQRPVLPFRPARYSVENVSANTLLPSEPICAFARLGLDVRTSKLVAASDEFGQRLENLTWLPLAAVESKK